MSGTKLQAFDFQSVPAEGKEQWRAQRLDILEFALNRVHEAILMVGENARFLYANDECRRTFGFELDELLTLSVPDIAPALPVEAWPSHWREIREKGGAIFEVAVRRKDGSVIPAEVTASYIEYGQSGFHMSIVRDLSERKTAEAQRVEHLHLLQSLDKINCAIAGAGDLEQMMRDALDVVLEVFECDRAFLQYPCDPDAPFWSVPMERTRAGHPGACARNAIVPTQPHVAESFRLQRASSGALEIREEGDHSPPLEDMRRHGFRSGLAMALYPKIGQPWSFGVHQCSRLRQWTKMEKRLLQEIGRRLTDGLTGLLAHSEVLQSEIKYREVFEHVSDALFLFDVTPEGRLLNADLNSAAETLCGVSKAFVLGKDAEMAPSLIVPKLLPLIRECASSGEPGACEEEHQLPGGDRILNSTLLPVRNDAGSVYRVIAFVRDITERKRAEKAVLKLNAELEQRVEERTSELEKANKELQAFSYSVSHDLRAPLRAVDGYSRILLEDYTEALDAEGQRYLGLIHQGASRMGQLINDILAFSRMSHAELGIDMVDMAGLAREVFAEACAETSERDVEFVLGDLPPARCDRAMMRQVLSNLLGNAVKYSGRKSQPRVEFSSADGDGEILYWVSDNGAGFDMEHAEKLFGLFQRLHSSEQFEGTGLGLAIVKSVIERHGGRVGAEAKVGEGARIWFSLPKTATLPKSS